MFATRRKHIHLTLLGLVASAGLAACSGASDTAVRTPGAEMLAPPGPSVFADAAPTVARVEAGLRDGAAIHLGGGEYLTAAHVIRDALEITVQTAPDATPISAEVVGVDFPADLALLRVGEFSGPVLELTDTEPVPGTEVFTLGHADGRPWTIQRGIVSGATADGKAALDVHVGPGSSGGPVLTRTGDATTWVGLVDQALAGGTASMVSAERIAALLPELRSGVHRGWTESAAFLDTVPSRAPLVHQLILATRVATGPSGTALHGVHDTLAFPAFPALHTVELEASWRYFFTGTHTFGYRVARIGADGTLIDVHDGPERTFDLADELKSYVHRVEIDLEFDAPGHYVAIVETNGRVTAVSPFRVDGPDGAAEAPTRSPFALAPVQEVLVIASAISGTALDGTRGDLEAPSDAVVTGPIDIEAAFNLVRLDSAAPDRPLVFDTWARWVGLEPGAHTAQIELVDSAGIALAQSRAMAIEVSSDPLEPHEHVARWSVSFPSRGLYFVLIRLDGEITRATPLWVE